LSGKYSPRVILIEHTPENHDIKSVVMSRYEDRTRNHDEMFNANWVHRSPSMQAIIEFCAALRYDLVYYGDTDLIFVNRDES